MIGLLSAIPYLAGIVAMMVTALYSDRSGERRWFVAGGTLVCGAGLVAAALVPGFGLSMVMLSMAMAGLSAMVGPFWTLTSSFVQGAGAAAGIAFINSIANFGGFLGPYAVGYLRDQTQGFAAGLIATGVVVGGCGAAVLLLRPRPAQKTDVLVVRQQRASGSGLQTRFDFFGNLIPHPLAGRAQRSHLALGERQTPFTCAPKGSRWITKERVAQLVVGDEFGDQNVNGRRQVQVAASHLSPPHREMASCAPGTSPTPPGRSTFCGSTS